MKTMIPYNNELYYCEDNLKDLYNSQQKGLITDNSIKNVKKGYNICLVRK